MESGSGRFFYLQNILNRLYKPRLGQGAGGHLGFFSHGDEEEGGDAADPEDPFPISVPVPSAYSRSSLRRACTRGTTEALRSMV